MDDGTCRHVAHTTPAVHKHLKLVQTVQTALYNQSLVIKVRAAAPVRAQRDVQHVMSSACSHLKLPDDPSSNIDSSGAFTTSPTWLRPWSHG